MSEEHISSDDDLPRILKEKTFKMSEMIVSWKYVLITDIGEEKFHLFQCIDSIKLELTYQVFLHLMKTKDPNKELE